MRQYFFVFVIAAVVTTVLCWIVLRLALKHHWYPAVRARDVHTTPKPRLGGVAMYLGMLAAFGFATMIGWFDIVFQEPGRVVGVLIAATLIVVVGVVDDFVDLDWMLKLAAQIIAGLVLALSGVAFTSLPIGGVTVGSEWMSISFTVLAVVFVMNAVNFIDGLDGLVAGIAIIANGVFLAYSYLLTESMQTSRFSLAALLSTIVVGVCAGFLPWNWNPSKMFMGDGGALLLGLLMAASTIAVTGEVDPLTVDRNQLYPAFLPLVVPLAILVVPGLDFVLAVVRRLAAGKSPFSADRKHLHHRLLDMGHTQRRAVLVFYAWATVIAVGALSMFIVRPAWLSWVAIGIGCIICTVMTILPLSTRKLREWQAQRSPAEVTGAYDPLDRLGVSEADRARRAAPAPLAIGERLRRVAGSTAEPGSTSTTPRTDSPPDPDLPAEDETADQETR